MSADEAATVVAVLARGTTDYRQRGWSVGDYARLVMMLDEGLSALARDMVSCLGILVAAAPPEDSDTEPIPPRGPALERGRPRPPARPSDCCGRPDR
jgi:hypothetical protein